MIRSKYFRRYKLSESSYAQLAAEIDLLRSQCKKVSYKQLPSTFNRSRKTAFIKNITHGGLL